MKNQIIFSTSDFNDYFKKEKKFNFFHVLLIFSIIIISFCILYFIFEKNNDKKISNISSDMSDRYSISKIYSDFSFSDNSFFIGSIKIPKINIDYPIIYTSNPDYLKISPCKFYGANPNEFGNFCIAGHNYNNSVFFSNIKNLDINDSIFITDSCFNTLEYSVTQKKEVSENDTSILYPSKDFIREITLITCTNKNNNRIIVKAIQKSK